MSPHKHSRMKGPEGPSGIFRRALLLFSARSGLPEPSPRPCHTRPRPLPRESAGGGWLAGRRARSARGRPTAFVSREARRRSASKEAKQGEARRRRAGEREGERMPGVGVRQGESGRANARSVTYDLPGGWRRSKTAPRDAEKREGFRVGEENIKHENVRQRRRDFYLKPYLTRWVGSELSPVLQWPPGKSKWVCNDLPVT